MFFKQKNPNKKQKNNLKRDETAFSFDHLIMKFIKITDADLRDWFKFACYFLSLPKQNDYK